jgi:hypothetical protein
LQLISQTLGSGFPQSNILRNDYRFVLRRRVHELAGVASNPRAGRRRPQKIAHSFSFDEDCDCSMPAAGESQEPDENFPKNRRRREAG